MPSAAGNGETLVIVNVGDSRAYLLRDGELGQITEDHSVADELLRAGQMTEEQAAVDRRRHVLTRVLGMDAEVVPDRFDIDPFRGDRVLLATDGLTNEVSDSEIASVLRRIEDPGEAARELARLAKTSGGADNITVVLVDVVNDDDRSEKASDALAKDPPRPRGLITSAERDSRLRDIAGESRPASMATPAMLDEPVRRGRKLRITIFGLAILLIAAAAVGATVYFGRPWYVSDANGRVALFRGHGDGSAVRRSSSRRARCDCRCSTASRKTASSAAWSSTRARRPRRTSRGFAAARPPLRLRRC